MNKKENEKLFQFVKLCSALTKQGLNFTRQKGVRYALTFDKQSAKRLLSHETRTPFVEALIRIAGDNKNECYQFQQLAGR